MCIKGSLESARASVLINGSSTNEFSLEKGVTKGDRLFHFLFINAMDGLSVAMKTACGEGIFRDINIPNVDPTTSHLLYANDMLFVGEWNKINIKNLA